MCEKLEVLAEHDILWIDPQACVFPELKDSAIKQFQIFEEKYNMATELSSRLIQQYTKDKYGGYLYNDLHHEKSAAKWYKKSSWQELKPLRAET